MTYEPPQQTPKPVEESRRGLLKFVLIGVGALLALCCVGVGVAMFSDGDAGKNPTSAGPTSPGAFADVAEPTTEAPAPPPKTTKAAPPPAPAKPKPVQVDDGNYTVGEDIPAGTYRVTEAVHGMCYWGITRTGTNGEDIIANDIVSGGFPRVTVKKGQDFEANGCGTWEKIK